MLINLRNALMAGKKSPLPPGARWVEYLESTGTQWVNIYTFTGSETSLRYNIDFVITQDSSSSQDYVLGVNSLGRIGPRLIKFGSNFWYSCDSGNAVFGQSVSLNQRYDIDFTYNSDGTIESSINGGAVSTYQRSFYSYQGGFNYLFGMAGNSTYGVIGRIYRMKMWVDSTLIRDFHPIAIGTTGYMLDLVSGEYLQYGNAGTGDFVLGPDVVPVNFVDGEAYNSSGAIITEQGFSRIDDYLPVIGGHSVTFNYGGASNSKCALIVYDSGKTRIDYWSAAYNNERTITMNANGAFVRFAVYEESKQTAFLRDNTTGEYIMINGKRIV